MSGSAEVLTDELLLKAYSRGIFPMVHEDGELYWHDPDPRAIFPLDRIVPDRTMRKVMRNGRFRLEVDSGFEAVMRACADRPETWIDERMIQAYTRLHHAGHAHCVTAMHQGVTVGGIYGVQLGAAFFGESMYSRMDNAGKAAFHGLVNVLKERGFQLFDTQYINDFTQKLGAQEIPRSRFRELLDAALAVPDAW